MKDTCINDPRCAEGDGKHSMRCEGGVEFERYCDAQAGIATFPTSSSSAPGEDA